MTSKRFDHSGFDRSGFGYSEDAQGTAALFALGSLRGEEKEAFEEHVCAGCADCQHDLRSFEDVLENLALAATPAEPSKTVRRRLLDSLATEPQRSSGRPEVREKTASGILLQQSGLLVTRAADIPWRPVAPGISCKVLSTDSKRGYSTCLIRAEAGARYPSHRHADVEELFVLEGDLHVHGVAMHAGDYCRAEANSIHEETFTESGCLLLQIGSQLDQMQA